MTCGGETHVSPAVSACARKYSATSGLWKWTPFASSLIKHSVTIALTQGEMLESVVT